MIRQFSINWPVFIWITVVHLLAAVGLLHPTKKGLVALVTMYVITGLGTSLGLHRYFSHRSFELPKIASYVLAVMGTLALQNTILFWVAYHRMHHAYSDTNDDPHNSKRGFWFSHMGWILMKPTSPIVMSQKSRFAKDIIADPFLSWLSKLPVYLGIQITLIALLWTLFGYEVMMWGVWVRLCVVYHNTWIINSVCHKWGYRNYETKDCSRNNLIFSISSFGDSFHNNHHAHPESAKHGHHWWELDINWYIILLLKKFKIANTVKF